MTVPIEMPALIHGAGTVPREGACVMQAAAWLASNGESWTDSPDCVHPSLRRVAIRVNDSIGDIPRHQLWPLIPRMLGTVTGDRAYDIRTGVVLAVWSANRVLPLIRNAADHEVAVKRIASAQHWLDTGDKPADTAAAYAADAAYAAAYAAAAYAADAAADTAADADADADADAAEIKFLTDLLDEHDRLTGHVPADIPAGRWEALRNALTGE